MLVRRSSLWGYRARKHSEDVIKESGLGKLTCHFWCFLSNMEWPRLKCQEMGKSAMWLTGAATWCLQTCRYRDQQLPALPYPGFPSGQKLPPKPSRKRLLWNSRLGGGILERCYFWFKAPGGAEKKKKKNLCRAEGRKGRRGNLWPDDSLPLTACAFRESKTPN